MHGDVDGLNEDRRTVGILNSEYNQAAGLVSCSGSGRRRNHFSALECCNNMPIVVPEWIKSWYLSGENYAIEPGADIPCFPLTPLLSFPICVEGFLFVICFILCFPSERAGNCFALVRGHCVAVYYSSLHCCNSLL